MLNRFSQLSRKQTVFAAVLLCLTCLASSAFADDAGYWRVKGNQIVNQRNEPVRISGVNWYGFETTTYVAHGLWAQDYHYIIHAIRANGYNVIRIPFSNEVVETNPVPGAISYTNANGDPINTDLKGLHSLEILDRIIDYAGRQGLKVILDNHRSEAGNSAEDSGLWYTAQYPESSWIRDWALLTLRYRHNPTVIGVDLRNEPHNAYIPDPNRGACWTGDVNTNANGCPTTDTAHNWPQAATRAGNVVLAINPRLLIFVEGVDEYNWDWYWNGGNLEGVANYPVTLFIPNHVVYSAHDYGPDLYRQPWFNDSTTLASLSAVWDKHWGYVSEQGIAPIWLGEFGTPNNNSDIVDTTPGSQGQWFSSLVAYLGGHPQFGWTYWALNGNDWFGLLDGNFDATPANPLKQALLQTIQQRPQHK